MSYPIPSWLYLRMLNEQPRPDAAAICHQAAAAIAQINARLARSSRPAGSSCGRCHGPIITSTMICPHCGTDYLAGERRSTNALAAVQRALRERRRDQVIADGQWVDIEYRAATTTSVG